MLFSIILSQHHHFSKQTNTKKQAFNKMQLWRNENIFSTAPWFWKVHIFSFMFISFSWSQPCWWMAARAILLGCCTFVDLRIFADWGDKFQQTNASQILCYCSLSLVNLKMFWNNYSIQNFKIDTCVESFWFRFWYMIYMVEFWIVLYF